MSATMSTHCSHHPECEHGIGHLAEAGDVGAADVVDVAAVRAAVLDALLVDAPHDLLQAAVDLLARPGDAHRVLGHLEPRDRHPAGIGGLARPDRHAGGPG